MNPNQFYLFSNQYLIFQNQNDAIEAIISKILALLKIYIPDIEQTIPPPLDRKPIPENLNKAAQNVKRDLPEPMEEDKKESHKKQLFEIIKTLYDIYSIGEKLGDLPSGDAFKEVKDLIGYFFNNQAEPDNFKGNIYQSIKRVPIVLDFHKNVQEILPNKTLSDIENLSSEFSDQYYDKMSKAIITEGFADGVQITQNKTIMLTVNHLKHNLLQHKLVKIKYLTK